MFVDIPKVATLLKQSHALHVKAVRHASLPSTRSGHDRFLGKLGVNFLNARWTNFWTACSTRRSATRRSGGPRLVCFHATIPEIHEAAMATQAPKFASQLRSNAAKSTLSSSRCGDIFFRGTHVSHIECSRFRGKVHAAHFKLKCNKTTHQNSSQRSPNIAAVIPASVICSGIQCSMFYNRFKV